MNDDKRMIQNYEVKNTIHIGGKELLFAEDLTAKEPYMVCNCQWDNPLSIDVYDKAVACTDYLEAMTEFLERASFAIQQVKEQRAERGVSCEPLTASDCIPGSKNAHYENQLVVIKPEKLVASARTADNQLVFAVSGFGCDPEARGKAVFCQNLFTGKTMRWDRQDVAGLVLPERIPEWAHQRLAELGVTVAKPELQKVYMASVEHARENGEIAAYRESLNQNQACAIRINDAINDSYKGDYCYDLPAALRAVTEEYGMERVQVVLANTLDYKDYDGRFSHVNKQWAKSVPLPELPKERRSDFVCEAHPAILDGFVNHTRKVQQEKKPSVMAQLKTTAKTTQPTKKDTVKKQQER